MGEGGPVPLLIEGDNSVVESRRRVAAMATNAERRWANHLESFFQRVKISELSTADFNEYRALRLTAGASHATINRVLLFLVASCLVAGLNLGWRVLVEMP